MSNCLLGRNIDYFVLGLLLFFSFYAKAEPIVIMRMRYYPVSGITKQEILKSIITTGPNVSNVQGVDHHAGQTIWTLSTHLKSKTQFYRCRIVEIRVDLDIEYVLPKLQHSANVSESLHSKWRQFSKAILLHEQGHKDIAYEAASELSRELQSLLYNTPCPQAKTKANEIYQLVIDKYKLLQQAYDQKSANGEIFKRFLGD